MKYPIAVAEYAEVRDAAGVLVALCFHREDAQLIADLVNAAEVQRVQKIGTIPVKEGQWVATKIDGWIWHDETFHQTPHAAILAADKWLKDKEKGGGVLT